MTKTDRAKMHRQGKIILRAQFNRKTLWGIYRYSDQGGWLKYPADYYHHESREACEKIIDALANSNLNIVKDV